MNKREMIHTGGIGNYQMDLFRGIHFHLASYGISTIRRRASGYLTISVMVYERRSALDFGCLNSKRLY